MEGAACELASYAGFHNVAVLRSLISGAVSVFVWNLIWQVKYCKLGHLAPNKGGDMSSEGEEIERMETLSY